MGIKFENFLEFAAGDSRKLEFAFKFALNRVTTNHSAHHCVNIHTLSATVRVYNYNEMITKGNMDLYPHIPYAMIYYIRALLSTTIPLVGLFLFI